MLCRQLLDIQHVRAARAHALQQADQKPVVKVCCYRYSVTEQTIYSTLYCMHVTIISASNIRISAPAACILACNLHNATA